jgi:predicted HTH domain antitoxin
MLARNIDLTITEDILMALNESQEQFKKDIKRYAAIKFFEDGKLSLGKAAKLAEMKKTDFIKLLSSHNVSVYNYLPNELRSDLVSLRKVLKK